MKSETIILLCYQTHMDRQGQIIDARLFYLRYLHLVRDREPSGWKILRVELCWSWRSGSHKQLLPITSVPVNGPWRILYCSYIGWSFTCIPSYFFKAWQMVWLSRVTSYCLVFFVWIRHSQFGLLVFLRLIAKNTLLHNLKSSVSEKCMASTCCLF